MADKKPPSSYRAMQTELDAILTELQSADLDIDKAMELYKKGQKQIGELEDYLKKAKNKIENIK